MQNVIRIFVKTLYMNSIIDKKALTNFLNRSEAIASTNTANWGKMDAAQMFQHLNKSLESIFSSDKVKRMFIGRIIGKMILKKALNDKPIDKNTPTAPSFVADSNVDFEIEKQKWIDNLNKFNDLSESNMEGKVHPFFGKMTGNEWNSLIYKHVDHHLKQFENE